METGKPLFYIIDNNSAINLQLVQTIYLGKNYITFRTSNQMMEKTFPTKKEAEEEFDSILKYYSPK